MIFKQTKIGVRSIAREVLCGLVKGVILSARLAKA
jgi:hypothetical protein